MAVRTRLVVGMKSVTAPRYPSEAGYVAQMNEQVQMLEDQIRSIVDQFENVTNEIMLEALQPVFDETQRIVPVDHGDLKESGYLEITGSKKAPRVELGYGHGGHPRYAAYVHEITQYQHAAPTQAKFVERPMLQDLDGIRERIATGLAAFAGLT